VFTEDSVVRFRQFKLIAFEFAMHVDIEAQEDRNHAEYATFREGGG